MSAPEWSLTQSGAFDADFGRLGSRLDAAELHGSTILLTGGTGFFGLWLIEYFDWLQRVAGVRVTVHALSRDPARVLAQHPAYRHRPWLRVFGGDVRDFEKPEGRIDYILHGAADTSAEAGRHPRELFDVLHGGARRVLDIAAAGACRRVLIISSGAVYGQVADPGLIRETRTTAPDPMDPGSVYGEGKRVCEALGTYMAMAGRFEVVTARCFAFVGAGLPLDGHFAIGNFIRNALEGNDIRLASTGQSVRSYLYAADLALWLVALLMRGRPGTAYNVGSDQALTVHATACRVRDVLAPGLRVTIADNPATAVTHYAPDIDRARTELGLDVWTDLDTAIRRTAADAARFGPHRGSA
ncbi:NAD-dependent epimerase/dehydratase family protein [Methylobacterium sp. A54F]